MAISGLIRTPMRRIVALLLFVNISVFALVWVSLDASYRQYQDRAATLSRNINRLVSQGVAADIDRVDLGLRAAADEAQRLMAAGHSMGDKAMESFLGRLHSRLIMADSVRVSDAAGVVLAGSGGIPPGVTIGDRDYFARLRDDAKSGLVVSSPILGKISGKWVLVFARRITAPDGGFGGVVYAPVTIEWFERKFNDLEVGANGTVVMRGDASRDFDLLARFPHAGYVGQTKVSETFRATITANPQGGTYEAHAGADNIRRVFSYRAIDNLPMITLVGLATEDFFAEWWREATKILVLAGIFSIVTILGGLGMARAWGALEQRSEELARSNADLEQFAYVASHDLQTPLRNIVSYTQLLERRYRGKLDSDADDFITFIVDSSRQMGHLISDLLEYSLLSDRSRGLTPISAQDAAAQAMTMVRSDLEAAGGDIAIGQLPVVMADMPHLVSLFQNLLGNAIKYRSAERKLQVTVQAEKDGADHWTFSVSDNGIGIEAQYHEKIFVIFQRLQPAQYPGGTGIGLAVCRRIVQRFGGRLWIESTPDVGTTFHFSLMAALEG
ncbi:MAG: two-component sensor histidine kinase [Magnetospirillum sp.]|nr:two-component sensor histidine kinase [Magnetospirillum sp.]